MPLYFDATFSWSGYAYQGKVGIYIVLKHLNQYNGNYINVYFNDWELEFEWLEDFSIKQSGIYRSLHQVKTLNSTRIASYNNAITQTIENSQDAFNYNITPYFHVSSNVANPHNIFYMYNINGINQQYCPLNEINNLIQEEILIFLENHNREDFEGETQVTHFYRLLAIMDNHVRQRHQNIKNIPQGQRQIETISFLEIINSLKTNSMEFTNERMIYEKKEYFEKVIDEFCQNKSDEIKNKLKIFIRRVFNLKADFVKFSKSLVPHIFSIYDNEMSITDFQDLLHQDLLKGAFLKIIEQIDKDHNCIEHKFIYEKDYSKFLPTAITRSQDDCNEVCSKILENPFAVEDLYEMDFFITERINCDSIDKEANNFNEIRDEDLQIVENKADKINELKRVEMIDINRAKGIIDA